MRLGLRFCAVGLASALGASAGAEMPAGEYTIEVGGTGALARPHDLVDLCLLEGLCLEGDLDTSASGEISGAAAMDGEVEGVVLALDVGISGHVGGSTVKPKVAMTLDIDGTAEYGGFELLVTGSGKAKCSLDRLDPSQLGCKGRLKLCIYDGATKVGCDSGPFDGPLPFERAPFDLQIVAATDERNVVTGTADVLIEDVPVYSYDAKGKYKPTADTTNLKLTSTDPAVKTKIALKKARLQAGGASAGTIAFKVAGQSGKVEIAP